MSQSINRCRVDPVHAELQRPMNRRDRIVVVLRSPAELPPRTADGPCAISNRSDLQIRIAESPDLHANLLLAFDSWKMYSDSSKIAIALRDNFLRRQPLAFGERCSRRMRM